METGVLYTKTGEFVMHCRMLAGHLKWTKIILWWVYYILTALLESIDVQMLNSVLQVLLNQARTLTFVPGCFNADVGICVCVCLSAPRLLKPFT